MEGLDEWLPPASAGTETGLQTAQVIVHRYTSFRYPRKLLELLLNSRQYTVKAS